MIGQSLEQWRHFRVFEAVELGDNVITFLARLHPVNKALQAVAAQPEMINALREHASEEESVVADVLADLALAIERGSWPEYRVRFHQHLAHIGQWLAG